MRFREEVLQQLVRLGSDITQPHGFDFYLYFPSRAAAEQAAQKARESDFVTKVQRGTTSDKWLCMATTKMVPQSAPLDAMAGFFEELAAAFNGDFDGWEADVIKPVPAKPERN